MPDLTTLVNLAAQHGLLLAATLSNYQQQHKLDDVALAAQLQCSLEDLVHLKLCENPRPNHFEEDVARIAQHVHADAPALAQLLSTL